MQIPLPVTEIQKILPHRYPFLLIDRIVDVTKRAPEAKNNVGLKIKAIKNVTMNEPYFQGHFPGNPIMPGVMIIEAMAQAAALLAYFPKPDGSQWTFYIVGVDKAKFRRPITPGDQITFELTLLKDRGTLFVFHGEARVDGELCTEAEIMAKMV